MDVQHKHPTLLAAVDCLQRCEEAAPRPLSRWLLAFTLARNPWMMQARRGQQHWRAACGPGPAGDKAGAPARWKGSRGQQAPRLRRVP